MLLYVRQCLDVNASCAGMCIRAGSVPQQAPGIPGGLFVVNGTNQEGEVDRPTITGTPHDRPYRVMACRSVAPPRSNMSGVGREADMPRTSRNRRV